MTLFDTVIERNAQFAQTDFKPELRMMPSADTIVVGCVDPRVDPAVVLGLAQGETAVIRNVGGRVNPALIETLEILKVVAEAGGRQGGVRNLILLQHTDCGIIGCYHHAPDMLAHSMGVETADLDGLAITDPHKAVAHDIAAVKADPKFADDLVVSGMVYDVKSGRVEVVAPAAPLRAAAD
ncbi:carbonic anhydrase [soil metagenome]